MRVRTTLLGAVGALTLASLLTTSVAAGSPAPTRTAARFEVRFMEQTVMHHLMGVEMAQQCVRKATAAPPSGDASLRARCATMAKDQAAEAAKLQGWLLDWYGIRYDPNATMGNMISHLRMARGEHFDVDVSRMFVKHHAQQIRNSTKCLMKASHRSLLDFCVHTIVEQSREIVDFREILDDHGASVLMM